MGRPKITSEVCRLLDSETGGVPRKINSLMSRVLLMGAIEHAELIDQSLVGRVLADLNGDEVDISVAADAPVQSDSPLWQKPKKSVSKHEPSNDDPISAEPKYVVPEPEPIGKAMVEEIDRSNVALNLDPEPMGQAILERVDNISKRLALLETRMNGQEENLHRVLTMLIDWVESDAQSKDS